MRCIRKDNEDVVTKFVKSVIAGDMEQALTLMRADMEEECPHSPWHR